MGLGGPGSSVQSGSWGGGEAWPRGPTSCAHTHYEHYLPGKSSSVGKESACSAEDPGSISGLGRLPGEGNGKPLQYSCLENPIDGEAW